jgi:hypothetical protein
MSFKWAARDKTCQLHLSNQTSMTDDDDDDDDDEEWPSEDFWWEALDVSDSCATQHSLATELV